MKGSGGQEYRKEGRKAGNREGIQKAGQKKEENREGSGAGIHEGWQKGRRWGRKEGSREGRTEETQDRPEALVLPISTKKKNKLQNALIGKHSEGIVRQGVLSGRRDVS